jgi:hypothetical protein
VSVPGRRQPARQRGRAGQLRGRRRECDLLNQLLDSVHAGESRVLVVCGEPGAGKTALLDYLVEQASGCRVAHAAGVESEMELVYAGLHQLLTPMLDRLERLPAPQANALRTAFGLTSGPAPDRFLVGLAALGLLADAAADRPFADDTEHTSYDPAWARRYWQVLSQVNLLLEEFAARFSGKVSPVHHFWHTFDIAHTRFSDRQVDQPAGLADQPLQPAAAWWDPRDGSHLAVLRYDDARATSDPRASVLDFYESTYQAGARLVGWDIRRLACPAASPTQTCADSKDQSWKQPHQ